VSVKIIWVNRHTIVDNIHYAEHESKFGNILIASTEHGVCSAELVHKNLDKAAWMKQLIKKWRKTQFIENKAITENYLNSFLESQEPNAETDIVAHIHGSPFQQEIWKALLDIPLGSTKTYRQIATAIGKPKAQRAVGTAIAANPLALIIPCHRVVRSGGGLGGYRWGEDKKTELLEWELNNKPE